MPPIDLGEPMELPSDMEVARRMMFAMAKVADRLGLPLGCSADVLLQSAMESLRRSRPTSTA